MTFTLLSEKEEGIAKKQFIKKGIERIIL